MKRALAAAALLTLAFAAAATPAHAAGTALVIEMPGSVQLVDPPGIENDRMAVAVTYQCVNNPNEPWRSWYLHGVLTREGMNTFYFGSRYVTYQQATCTGQPVSQVLPFKRDPRDTESPGHYLAGEADLTFGLFDANGAPEQGGPQVSKTAKTNVVLPPTPPPVKAPAKLTTNATPEPVTIGATLTVKGTVKRDGKGFRAATSLQFRTPSGSYKTVRSVTSTSAGNLRTTVKADRDGCFRYSFAGNATTEPGVSTGDCVDVIPKPKDYANCAALRKAYPHGVGRTGAKDKGGDVTNFTRDNATYKLNDESDRDKDKIACEKK